MLSLLLAMTAFLAAFVLNNELSNGTMQTYTFLDFNNQDKQEKLSLTVNKGEHWQDRIAYPEQPFGAQYDFVVSCNTSARFQRWKAEIYFADEVAIDSSWNGDFKVNGNRIDYTPEHSMEMDLTTVFSGTARTFGAIIYTGHHELPEKVVLSGYWYTPIFQRKPFWILVSVWILLLFFYVQTLVSWRQAKQYLMQIENDYEMVRQAMLTLTDVIDAKDSYTRGHSTRVAMYSEKLAEQLGMEEDERRDLYYTALMHDCGKIGVPDAVLKKPGRLTDDEFRLIKAHPEIGDHLLSNFTSIPNIRAGAHYHHERYDGTGYPEGLKDDEIPYIARIICIADAVDAMSTNRCYRDRLSEEEIIRELMGNAGVQFDPVMVPMMIRLIRDGIIEEAQKRYPNRG